LLASSVAEPGIPSPCGRGNSMKIAIHHHLGLGDHFICNGLVRCLKNIYNANGVFIPSKQRYYETISAMYADDPEIHVISYPGDSADNDFPKSQEWIAADKTFRVGHERTKFPHWDKSFYDCVDMPFSFRWSAFKVNRDKEAEQCLLDKLNITGPFVLIHRDSSTGSFDLNLNTETRKIEVTPISNNLLDWYGAIEMADEIHCVDSSFMSFAQSVKDNGFFHDIRRLKMGNLPSQLNPTWRVVSYENSNS